MRQLKITKSITKRETVALEKYLRDIGKLPVITADEEVNLTRLIKQGDTLALDKLTKANLRFVVSVAKQYHSYGIALSDLINEGNLGLIKAAQRFDDTKGFKFISYAVWWIRQSIIRALAEHSRIVRLPLNQINSLNKLHRAIAELEQEFEREPSPDELALLLNISTDEVQVMVGIAGRHVSMDAPVSPGQEFSMVEVLQNPNAEDADYQVCYRDSLSNEIKRSLDSLGQKQSQILKMYFGIEPMRIDDIGAVFDITPERVRHIKDAALGRLRGAKQLKDYLRD